MTGDRVLRRFMFSNKGWEHFLFIENGLHHFASPPFFLINGLNGQFCLLLSSSQPLNFTIVTVTSLLTGLMAVITDNKFIFWTFNLWSLRYASSNNQMLWAGSGCNFPYLIFVALLNVRLLFQDVLLVFLHHKKTVLSLLNFENLLALSFDLFFNLSISFVSLNQLFDLTFDFRQVLCVIDSTTVVTEWVLACNSIGDVFLIFVFWWTYRPDCLIWTDLFFLVFLFGFVFWRKVLLILTRKIVFMTGRDQFMLISWGLIFLYIIWLLFVLIISILLTVFLMKGTSIPFIKFNFWFSVDKDFLRWYWDDFCDFGSDLSSLRRTEESVVLDISYIVMGFWGFDFLFGKRVGVK